jgi:hypothetical protein
MKEESTLLVDPLSSNLVVYVRALLRKRLEKESAPSFTYRGGEVFVIATRSGEEYVALRVAGELAYFVQHKPVKAAGLDFGRQVLVWRCRNTAASVGFANHVFFKLLLPQYRALISDVEQTPNGMAFWQWSLDHAMKQGDNCYLLDRRARPYLLTELRTWEDVNSHQDTLWGRTEGHLHTHAVISTTPLRLRNTP